MRTYPPLGGQGGKSYGIYSFLFFILYYLLIFSYLCIHNLKKCIINYHHIIIFIFAFRRGDIGM
jgi:hypothetical protein